MKHPLIARSVIKRIALFLSLLVLSGCATIQTGSQSAEVRAEQTLSISLAALDSFVAFEHRRRADVPAVVRDVAYRVRLNAPKALDSANALRIAYKSNRSAENKAGLLTALVVVDALVGEIRVWVPATSASGPGHSEVAALLREAEASKVVTAQSWVALVPVFVDLAREIYRVVNQVRETTKQDAEWTLQKEADFAAQLSNLKTAAHWQH